MYTTEKKVYKAKVGNLFVRSISTGFTEEIVLSPQNRFTRYLSLAEKDFLLIHFPEAEVKELIISDKETSW